MPEFRPVSISCQHTQHTVSVMHASVTLVEVLCHNQDERYLFTGSAIDGTGNPDVHENDNRFSVWNTELNGLFESAA